MNEITLKGKPYERGLTQGHFFRQELHNLFNSCPVWLGNMLPERVKEICDSMVNALKNLCPEMVEELRGISDASGLPFGDVCMVNFVSAIAALNGCSNLITLKTEEGPVLAKTSDIGNDYVYYCVQRVEPDHGYHYLAISWVGCLWAEVGINSQGLALGQGSAPIMPGQHGEGIPTLEYPRVILERCRDIEEAIHFCQDIPMAGKGLNMAMVDGKGQAAVIEKSGIKSAVRRPTSGVNKAVPGAALDGVFCTNHFLENETQGMQPLYIPNLPDLEENSQKRLANMTRFFDRVQHPSLADLSSILQTGIEKGGLLQDTYPEMITRYAYLLLPIKREMRISQGIPYENVLYSTYKL